MNVNNLITELEIYVDEDTYANVSEDTKYNTIRLLHAIPEETPEPELAVNLDGSVSLEWYFGRLKVLIIEVAGSGLHAVYINKGETLTVESTSGRYISPELIDLIHKATK